MELVYHIPDGFREVECLLESIWPGFSLTWPCFVHFVHNFNTAFLTLFLNEHNCCLVFSFFYIKRAFYFNIRCKGLLLHCYYCYFQLDRNKRVSLTPCVISGIHKLITTIQPTSIHVSSTQLKSYASSLSLSFMGLSPLLHLSSPPSLLSSISPLLHLSFPLSLLSSISPLLHLSPQYTHTLWVKDTVTQVLNSSKGATLTLFTCCFAKGYSFLCDFPLNRRIWPLGCTTQHYDPSSRILRKLPASSLVIWFLIVRNKNTQMCSFTCSSHEAVAAEFLLHLIALCQKRQPGSHKHIQAFIQWLRRESTARQSIGVYELKGRIQMCLIQLDRLSDYRTIGL